MTRDTTNASNNQVRFDADLELDPRALPRAFDKFHLDRLRGGARAFLWRVDPKFRALTDPVDHCGSISQ